MNPELLNELVMFLGNLRLAHWAAPTRTNEHATLGELYDGLEPLVDELAEVTLGKSMSRALASGTYTLAPRGMAELLAAGVVLIGQIRAGLSAGVDDDSLNLVADMSALINRARYKLHA